MRRIIAFLLAVFAFLSFASCKEKKEKKTDSIDVSYYAKLGQIPECEYKLGDDGGKIAEKLENKLQESENPEEDYYEVIEGEKTSKIFTADTHYIYNNDDKKLSKILLFDKAYGFELGTDKDTVVDAEKEYDLKCSEIELSEEEARDFSGTDECIYLEYDFDKCTVIFAFENNCLFGTEIKEK